MGYVNTKTLRLLAVQVNSLRPVNLSGRTFTNMELSFKEITSKCNKQVVGVSSVQSETVIVRTSHKYLGYTY